MKTKEELNALKEEVETESKERQKLTEEELEQVTGGNDSSQLPVKSEQYGYISVNSHCPVCNKGIMRRFYYPGGSYLRCSSINDQVHADRKIDWCGWSIDEKTGLPAIGG